MKNILVVGSINMDLVVSVDEFVKVGETKHSINLNYYSGGKGANQAVAAAKSGASVLMIGAVGEDSFSYTLLDELKRNGVQTDGVVKVPGESGLAIITVSEQGENQIVINPGANYAFSANEIKKFIDWQKCDCILLQNEISWATTEEIIDYGSKLGIPIWFNPAPARLVDNSLLKKVDLLILNEVEAEIITGKQVTTIDDAKVALTYLLNKGVQRAIITLGDKGSILLDGSGDITHQIPFPVVAVDTTAAGDTFIGSLASEYFVHKQPLKAALKYATAASALAVTKSGAQSSIPTKVEVERFLNDISYQ